MELIRGETLMRLHGIEKNDVMVRGINMKQKNPRLRATAEAHTAPWTLWRIFIRRGSLMSHVHQVTIKKYYFWLFFVKIPS